MSAAGIPQIAVVMGSCTAGGAYVPAMSDEAIIVKGQGTIFLGGPPLVKAATGEVVSAEDLGGADVHTGVSGVTDHFAESDAHAIGWRGASSARWASASGPRSRSDAAREPLYAAEELYGVVPADPRSRTTCAKSSRASSTARSSTSSRQLTARRSSAASRTSAAIPVGIVANNGILFSESALKGAHFIELCASVTSRWCFSRTSRASWSAANTKRAASPRTGPSS